MQSIKCNRCNNPIVDNNFYVCYSCGAYSCASCQGAQNGYCDYCASEISKPC